jgi:hypothetical protein
VQEGVPSDVIPVVVRNNTCGALKRVQVAATVRDAAGHGDTVSSR